VIEALLWGGLAASSLLIGALLGLARHWSDRVLGLVLAFGAGALISAISFDLAREGLRIGGPRAVAFGLAAGALTFFALDAFVLRRLGRSVGRHGDPNSSARGAHRRDGSRCETQGRPSGGLGDDHRLRRRRRARDGVVTARRPRRRTRWFVAGFLALVAVTPGVARAGDERGDPRVFVLGDSVVVGAQEAIAARLGTTGWQVSQVAAESLHTYNAPGVIDANAAAIGDTVVVGLGTNDGMTPAQFAGWIDDVLETLRDVDRVYWINLRQFAEWVPAANGELEAAADRWSNLEIIDWDERASGDPSLVFGDGIHLTATGETAFADLIGTTIDEDAGVAPPSSTTSASGSQTSSTLPASTAPNPSAASDDAGEGDGLDRAWIVVGGAVIAAGAGLVALNRRSR
jgi:lysophospholipase L1-like esterase